MAVSIKSLQAQIKDLQAQLLTEQNANRELGIKLKSHIAVENRLRRNAPPPSDKPDFAARAARAKQLALELGRAPTRAEVLA